MKNTATIELKERLEKSFTEVKELEALTIAKSTKLQLIVTGFVLNNIEFSVAVWKVRKTGNVRAVGYFSQLKGDWNWFTF